MTDKSEKLKEPQDNLICSDFLKSSNGKEQVDMKMRRSLNYSI